MSHEAYANVLYMESDLRYYLDVVCLRYSKDKNPVQVLLKKFWKFGLPVVVKRAMLVGNHLKTHKIFDKFRLEHVTEYQVSYFKTN